jgi:hypothetical protein
VPETRTIQTQFDYDIADIFKARMAFNFTGVNELIEPEIFFPFGEFKMAAAYIEYTDRGLLQKMLARLAKKSKLDMPQYLQQLYPKIDNWFNPDPKNVDPAMAQAAAKIKNYINTPETFTIQLKPTEGKSLYNIINSALVNISELQPRTLGLSLTVP